VVASGTMGSVEIVGIGVDVILFMEAMKLGEVM
jgi:hypothetical protein